MKNSHNEVNKKTGIKTVQLSVQKGTINIPWPHINNWLVAALISTVILGFKTQEPLRKRIQQPSPTKRCWRLGAIYNCQLPIGSNCLGILLPALLNIQHNACTKNGYDLFEGQVDTGEIRPRQRGYFRFHNVKMSAIMRELERWYNVKVIYAECLEDRMFSIGRIARKEKITKPLTIMALTGSIHYTISRDGKTLYITK